MKKKSVKGHEFLYHYHPYTNILYGGYMNKQLENKLTMYEGVWTFFGKNADIVNTVPMIKSSVDEFGTTLAAIHMKSSEVNTNRVSKARL